MPRRSKKFDDFYYRPSVPKPAKGGLKARSQRGGFARNWWAQQWIESLERLVDAGRLSRGRGYARKGQVLSIEETKDGISARVQGSRPAPYHVSIKVAPLNDGEWKKVIDALAEQAVFTAQLLAGEMPQEIERAFTAAGVSLFPARRGDLETGCSCPDYANPCKHVAATHYILAEQFDEDPFLLFRLRGRTQEKVMQALRERRANDGSVHDGAVHDGSVHDAASGESPAGESIEESEAAVPLEESLDRFWDLGGPLDQISFSIHPPAVEMPLLARLGEAAFVPAPGLRNLLRAAYQAIGRQAMRSAYVDVEKENPPLPDG
jgi:uncharacterized Zn finger protein